MRRRIVARAAARGLRQLRAELPSQGRVPFGEIAPSLHVGFEGQKPRRRNVDRSGLAAASTRPPRRSPARGRPPRHKSRSAGSAPIASQSQVFSGGVVQRRIHLDRSPNFMARAAPSAVPSPARPATTRWRPEGTSLAHDAPLSSASSRPRRASGRVESLWPGTNASAFALSQEENRLHAAKVHCRAVVRKGWERG